MKNKKSGIGIVINILIIIILAVMIVYFLTSKKYILETITVEGNKQIQTEEIINLTLFKTKQNIFTQRYFKSMHKLKNDPRIETANISIKFPNQINITVKERNPKYQISKTSRILYFG